MSLSLPELLSISADYGCADLRVAGEAHRYLRRVEHPWGEPIRSVAHYVGACLRLARRVGRELRLASCYRGDELVEREFLRWTTPDGAEAYVDGRLIAVGYRHESPSQWVRDGRLFDFLAYHWRASERPDRPGSTYNQTPERIYAAWRSGVPAEAVRLHLWRSDRIRPIRGRERKRLLRSLRAARRTTACRAAGLWGPERITPAALSQLGRLSPELQRALIEVSGGLPEVGAPPMRCADLRWDLLAPIAREMSADKTGRVRAGWARGKRLAELCLAAVPLVDGCDVYAEPICDVDRIIKRGYHWLSDPWANWTRRVSEWLAPEYAGSGLCIEQAAMVARGRSASEISGYDLPEELAQKWLRLEPDLDLSRFAWLYKSRDEFEERIGQYLSSTAHSLNVEDFCAAMDTVDQFTRASQGLLASR